MRTGRRVFYWVVISVLWGSVAALAIIATLKLTNASSFVPPFDTVIPRAASFGVDLAPIFAFALAITQGIRPFLISPAQFDAIHRILTGLRDHVVGTQTGVPYHFDRATLFQRRAFYLPWNPKRWRRWPFSGWLVPFERSGEATRHRGSCFLAPDDGDRAEGVAGQTWAQKNIVFVPPPNDPPLPDLTHTSSDADMQEYARRSFVDPEWVRQWLRDHKRGLATRYVGIPVELKSRVWGVIVLDLRSPTTQPHYDANLKLIATCMSAILGKGR